MAAKLGLDAHIYYLSSGTAGVAGTRSTWGSATLGINGGPAPANLTEIISAKNVTPVVSKGQADVSTRGNNGWEAVLGTLKRGSLEIETVWDMSDLGQLMLVQAFFTNANIPIAALDGVKTVVGTYGLWADFQVVDLNKGEPLEEGQSGTYTLKPGLSSVPPEWVKVTA